MRMPHLHHQSLPWRVDCVPLPDKPGVFVYVCTKNAGLSLAQRRRSLTQRKGEDVSVGEVEEEVDVEWEKRKLAPSTVTFKDCLLYTSPSPRDKRQSRMPSSA